MWRTFLALVLAVGLAAPATAQLPLTGAGRGGPSGGGGGGTISLVAHTLNGSGSAGVSSFTVTLNIVNTGDLVTVEVSGCLNSTCVSGAQSGPWTMTGLTYPGQVTSCSQVSGAQAVENNDLRTDLWVCPNVNTTGSTVFTATFGGSGASYPELTAQEWSGALTASPAELGNGATGSGTSASGTIASPGTTSQNNELVLSAGMCGKSGGCATITSGQTMIDSTVSRFASYQIVASSGSAGTNTFTLGATTEWAFSIAGIKHP